MGKLESTVAVVTGASSGIGREIAKLFAKEGASVVVIARRKARLTALVTQIEADGGKAVAVPGDVTHQEDVENAVNTAMHKFGKLDIVVNNAGVMDKMKPVTETDDALWNSVLGTNLTGPMRFFRAAIPHMLKNGGGRSSPCRPLAAYTERAREQLTRRQNTGFLDSRKTRLLYMLIRTFDRTLLPLAALTPKLIEIWMSGANWEGSNVRWVWIR